MTRSERSTPVGAAQSSALQAELRLPRPPGVFRRWLAARPGAVDWVIVGTYLFGCASMALTALVLGTAVIGEPGLAEQDPDGLGPMVAFITWPWILVSALITALTAVALRFRRRYPLAGLILVCVLSFLEQGLLGLPNSVALIFLLYAVPVYRSVPAGWVAFGIAAISGNIVLFLGDGLGSSPIGPSGFLAAADPLDPRTAVPLASMNTLWLLATLMVGINLGNRRRYVEALIDRAHQLAVEREQRAQLAAAAERSRIAREMHDIVAHSLSVVVTLSEAASVAVETQPAAAQQAMAQAAETGRGALAEMRRLLGVLNEDPAADGSSPVSGTLAPQPGAAQLPELIAGFRDAGLAVTLVEEGVPPADATRQLAVYRIVQEGLTNALRYAGPGARATVTVEHRFGGTRIEIVDSGRITRAADPVDAQGPAAIPGSGRGLAGARQRATMFGGELSAGPHGAGWRLRAELPAVEERDGHR